MSSSKCYIVLLYMTDGSSDFVVYAELDDAQRHAYSREDVDSADIIELDRNSLNWRHV